MFENPKFYISLYPEIHGFLRNHQAENNPSPAVTVPETASALWGLCDATKGIVILVVGSIRSIPVVLDLVQESYYRVYVVTQKTRK